MSVSVGIKGLLDTTKCYELRFTVSDYASGTLQWEIGDGSTFINLGPAIAADGDYTIDIDSTVFTALGATIPNFLRFSYNTGDYSIDNLGVFLDVDCTDEICSECLDLKDDHDCTGPNILITATNDNDFLLSDNKLLDYSSFSFTQSLRVFGHLDMLNFPYPEENIFKFSDGDKSTQYVDSESNLELLVQDIPPYLHKALRLMLVHDNVQVDGVRITKNPGDYTPDRVKESKLAPVIVEVQKYNQRDINKLC